MFIRTIMNQEGTLAEDPPQIGIDLVKLFYSC